MEKVQDVRLETERLIIRRHTMEDAPVLVELLDNLNVSRWTANIPHPYTLADAEEFITKSSELWQKGGHAAFVVDRKSDNKLVGSVGLHQAEEGEYELGYWIGEPYWGNGYASEAAIASVNWFLSNYSVSRLYARYDKNNAASERVLQKAGLTVPCGSTTCFSKARNIALDSNLLEYPL